MASVYVLGSLKLFILILSLLELGDCINQRPLRQKNSSPKLRTYSDHRPNVKFLRNAVIKNLVDNGDKKTNNESSDSMVDIRHVDREASVSQDMVVNASYNTVYTANVSKETSWTFKYPSVKNVSLAVRVWMFSANATRNYPLLFVVEEPRGIVSWQVPLAIQDEFTTFYYNNVSRTLCPYGQLSDEEYNIVVSTFSPQLVDFTILAQSQPLDVKLSTPQNTSLGPSEPRYFRFVIPDDIDSVIVKAESKDDICMILSVQKIMCPVFDLLTNVQLRGRHQTVTRKGAITLQRSASNTNGTFFVVLVATPSDFDCRTLETVIPAANFSFDRLKNVTLIIEPSISKSEFLVAVLAVSLWFLGFYIMTFVIISIYNCMFKQGNIYYSLRRKAHTRGTPTPPPELSEQSALTSPLPAENVSSQTHGATYGTILPDLVHRVQVTGSGRAVHQRSRSQPEMLSTYSLEQAQVQGHNETEQQEESSSSTSFSSLDEDDIDMLPDADREKDVFRAKTFLYLSDLSRKSTRKLSKKINLYPWNLITLAVFYALPVIQVVLTYQKVLNRTGDEDTCYYNFDCAHPLVIPYPEFRLATFNNVFSNLGYISLGFLFLLIVYRRDHLHRIQVKQSPHLIKHYGIPQHYGLFYSMGIALTMMGVLSACYHICPSYNNFQFDTSFMYVLAWILMLRIYQTRHPDINPHAHTAFFVLALAIFFVVVGVVYGTVYFWIVFVIVYCTFYLLVSVHVYYMGRYKLNFGLFRRVYNMWRNDGICCIKPMYVDRLILLLIGNGVNWFLAIFGCVIEPPDFASYMLSIFIINLMMYFAFYIVMKIRSGERLLLIPVIFTLISVILWGFSFFFFMKHVASWQLTPALSREHNAPCMLLNFYDSHDIWHFLSSMSMFFSFNMLLTLDDDLTEIPRDTIRVF
ncbi:hypothetical protein LSH36_5g17033 [Paralvinella palmiformis]|uniref:SID1 transmembrane family member 1 n=1 Tax=Paralvinella palmiformis TaxID=53620 RepID=A0AAD9KE77_9ANNE|nr:hypothetical protein LSH36_5g17033 [Paralvinella palmiformis]